MDCGMRFPSSFRLHQVTKRGSLDVKSARFVVGEIIAGLQSIHDLGYCTVMLVGHGTSSNTMSLTHAAPLGRHAQLCVWRSEARERRPHRHGARQDHRLWGCATLHRAGARLYRLHGRLHCQAARWGLEEEPQGTPTQQAEDAVHCAPSTAAAARPWSATTGGCSNDTLHDDWCVTGTHHWRLAWRRWWLLAGSFTATAHRHTHRCVKGARHGCVAG